MKKKLRKITMADLRDYKPLMTAWGHTLDHAAKIAARHIRNFHKRADAYRLDPTKAYGVKVYFYQNRRK